MMLSNVAMMADQAEDYERLKSAVEATYELQPDDAGTLNDYAWFLATVPTIEFRDPVKAVAMAERAVGLAADNASFVGTLGVAYYRNRQWEPAAEKLEQAIELSPGGGADSCYNHLYLAMARWQMDEKEEAHEARARAKELLEQLPQEQRPQHLKRLQRLESEWNALAVDP